jgi:asparagine synthase (glutamine-hydrolysing)
MCGIAGIIGKGSARPLIETITHRGPDGVRVEDGEGYSLAHARLSIIDLECGWQPLHAAGSTVIGNGEIYNYVELIEEFGLKEALATGSDFEPMLHLYARMGPAVFERLRGMYAFCLVGCDGRRWLVRDPFGIKPLYYARCSEGLAFASEPRALGRAALKPEQADELLALNYALESPFEGITRVEPGEVLEIDPNSAHPGASRGPGRVAAWVPTSVGMNGEKELIDRLDAVLEDSIRVHQRSDVPYGLFLSGGIDSASIATLMARLNERPVTAFTCGFDVPSARDERAQAERVATALKLDWRETTFGEEDFWRILPQVAWALDDPTADYATLPTHKLAEAAKGTLTVVLTGEGGDELFGGRPAEPQIDAPFLRDAGAGALARWRARACARARGTRLQQAQVADIATWLPNDLLLKLDRCLMAHGLEGRTPFLDREVAAFAFNLPDRMKVQGRYGKWLLRKWLERVCPQADPWGKKKGVTVPVAAWIAPRAADLGPKIAALKAVREVCDTDAVRAVFADEGQAKNRWPLLFFAVWSLIRLEGAAPDEALASLL